MSLLHVLEDIRQLRSGPLAVPDSDQEHLVKTVTTELGSIRFKTFTAPVYTGNVFEDELATYRHILKYIGKRSVASAPTGSVIRTMADLKHEVATRSAEDMLEAALPAGGQAVPNQVAPTSGGGAGLVGEASHSTEAPPGAAPKTEHTPDSGAAAGLETPGAGLVPTAPLGAVGSPGRAALAAKVAADAWEAARATATAADARAAAAEARAAAALEAEATTEASLVAFNEAAAAEEGALDDRLVADLADAAATTVANAAQARAEAAEAAALLAEAAALAADAEAKATAAATASADGAGGADTPPASGPAHLAAPPPPADTAAPQAAPEGEVDRVPDLCLVPASSVNPPPTAPTRVVKRERDESPGREEERPSTGSSRDGSTYGICFRYCHHRPCDSYRPLGPCAAHPLAPLDSTATALAR